MTQKQICLNYHLHHEYRLRGKIRLGGGVQRWHITTQEKLVSEVCWLLEMGCGAEKEKRSVGLWRLQLHRNHSVLATRALSAFWPSTSQAAHLAPCLIAYLSLQPVLHSFSICCWLPTCCLGNLRILCAELRGSGPFHSYLNWVRQAAGWEESWQAELCWGHVPSKADSQRWEFSSGVARRCHVGSFGYSKMIRKWRGKLLLMGQWIEYCNEWDFSPSST